MPDPSELLEAAEQAAASGHYAVAEPLLREAASLQEELLGLRHPDVANTLNNLGIVCEILGKPEVAEECFRRACAIAAASLDPAHPFVATSRKNLEEFCKARGLPVDLPWAVKPAASEPPPAEPGPAKAAPVKSAPVKSEPMQPSPVESPRIESRETIQAAPPKPAIAPPPVVPKTAATPAPPVRPATPDPAPASSTSRMVIMAGLAAVFLLVVAIATLRRSAVQETPPPATAPTATAPAPAAPSSSTPAMSPAPTPAPVAPVESKPAPGSKSAPSRPVQAAKGGAVTVSEVGVCRDLATSGNWRCTPIASPIAPARLFFYTRVKSATDTSIEQRWYRGDRLIKSADLSVRANPTAGYRTYSRNTVSAGEWRLEVRTKDGTVLHEERFTVR